MTRLSDPTDPLTSPLGRFAWDLRTLRDSMGVAAPSVDEISAREGIPRSTLYAALRGSRLPRREVVAAFARSWGGDEVDLLNKRSALERQLTASVDLLSTKSSENYTPSTELSPESIDVLRGAGVVQKYPPGAALYTEGDSCRDVLLIENGIVKSVASTPAGRSIVLALCTSGEILGELAALNNRHHTDSAVSATEVSVRRVSGDHFVDLVTKNPRVLVDITKMLATRLQIANERRTKFDLPAEERVVYFLQILSENYGKAGPDGAIIVPRILSNQEIADMAGVSRSTFTRCIDRLEQADVLENSQENWLVHGKLEDMPPVDVAHQHESPVDLSYNEAETASYPEETLPTQAARAWQYLQTWGISSLEDVLNAIEIVDEQIEKYSNPAFVMTRRPLPKQSELNRLELVLHAPELRPSTDSDTLTRSHTKDLKNFIEAGARVTRDTLTKIKTKVPNLNRPGGRASTKNNQVEFRNLYHSLRLVSSLPSDLHQQVSTNDS